MKRSSFAFCILGLAVLFCAMGASGDALEKLKARVDDLTVQNQQRADELASLSIWGPPIGTVMAYPGTWPPKNADGTPFEETELGWMRCDGRPLNAAEFPELSIAIGSTYPGSASGTFNLPDYQGLFLRGVAHGSTNDPDRDAREGGDNVGSTQKSATSMPVNAFVNSENGAFDPATPRQDGEAGEFNGKRFDRLLTFDTAGTSDGLPLGNRPPGFGGLWPPNLHNSRPMRTIPNHTHTISGGDHETRPVNRAVEWIIKTKPLRLH